MKLPALKLLVNLAFGLAAILILVLGWVLYEGTEHSKESTRRVTHTLEVLRSIDSLDDELNRAESKQRGYLLSGNAAFLSQRDQAFANSSNILARVRKLTADNADQGSRILRLDSLVAERLAVMQKFATQRQSDGQEAIAARMVGRILQEEDTSIYKLMVEMKLSESRLLEARRGDEKNSYQVPLIVAIVIVLIGLVVLGFVGFVLLVRARNRTERKLSDMAESLPGTVYQCRSFSGEIARRRFEFVSKSVANLFGVDRETMLRNPDVFWNCVVVEDKTLLVTALETSARTLQPLQCEFRIKHAHGEARWMRSTTSVRQEPDGSLLWNGYWADITDQKSLERELAEAQQVADEASRAKSDFLSTMSHEIRTPMNAIIGMAYLALKTDLTLRQRDYLKKIQGSGQHLLSIINDILDISRIEARKLTVEQTEFDLEKVLENVAGLVAEKTSSKGLELIFNVDRDVPNELIGDPLRVSQILINYVNNAVKFTDHGEVEVVISAREQSDKDVLLYVSVRDTGIGLTEEQRGRLFQSFQQADASTTRKYGGSGLGLAISKQLAILMHGEVGVQSEVGKGSTFWFTARLGKGVGNKRQLVLSQNLQGRRVLVVDDNENARAVLADLLKAMSFIIDEAASGQEAIKTVICADGQGLPYDIVFLDWLMPGINGIDTARQLRALPVIKQPHLVMVTAYGNEDVVKDADDAGLEDILIKPISASVLFDSVARLLGGVPSARPEKVSDASLAVQNLASIAGAWILLVEDNDLNQEVATELLRDAGFVVDLAENGEVALRRVQEFTYDVVLMDMHMPVLDGLSATREIRKLLQCAALPIIAMTANARAGDREDCLDAGMNDHVAKPIEPDDLWRALLKWVKPKSRAQANALSALRPATGKELPPGYDIPAGITGLDADAGLRRVLGKKPLYLSMLRKFVAGQKNAAAEIRATLASSDLSTAERLAHTTKGVAGNIGATPVQALAYDLERGVRNRLPADSITSLLDLLAAPLDELVASIERALPPEVMQKADAVNPEQLHAVCIRLQMLLAEDDSQAVHVFNKHAALLHSAFPTHFQPLGAAIKTFEFSQAAAVLEDAVSAVGCGAYALSSSDQTDERSAEQQATAG